MKKTIMEERCSVFTLPAMISTIPKNKLKSDHKTLVPADDNPTPGGFEKGVGNFLPDMPCIKCGTKLQINVPATNDAI